MQLVAHLVDEDGARDAAAARDALGRQRAVVVHDQHLHLEAVVSTVLRLPSRTSLRQPKQGQQDLDPEHQYIRHAPGHIPD
jgi:hypothetical protein